MAESDQTIEFPVSGDFAGENIDATSTNKTEQQTLFPPKKDKNVRYRLDTISRVLLAGWAAIVVSLYLKSVVWILLNNYDTVCLSDAVLSVLLATTTLNVLGLMYIVLKGYFTVDNREV